MIKQGDTIENKRTGQRMTFLQTWAETNGTQLQIDCISPPSIAREPYHVHPYQINAFKVLSGQLHFNINGKLQVACPGDTISIPKNTPHSFWNEGPGDAHYIQDFFPALKIDTLFETFFALARDGKLNRKGAPNMLSASVVMLAHHKELRLAKPSWGVQKIVFSILAPIGRIIGYKAQYI